MNSTYTPPPGGLYVPNSRTVGDIILRSVVIHFFATSAYAHLNVLLLRNQTWKLCLLQIVVFMFFPEFILVQLVFGIINTLLGRHVDAPFIYHFSGVLGMHTETLSDTSVHISRTDPDDLTQERQSWQSQIMKLAFVGLNSVPLLLSIMAYKQRLAFIYHGATYVANLGFDHSNGWVAIGGTIAITLATIVLLFCPKWISQALEKQSVSTSSGYLKFIENPLIVQIVVTSMVHQILLAVTNHKAPFLMIIKTVPWLPPLICGVILYLRRRYQWQWSWIRCGFLSFQLFMAGISIISQLTADSYELYSVSHGQVQGYNYRWKVKDWMSTKSKPT